MIVRLIKIRIQSMKISLAVYNRKCMEYRVKIITLILKCELFFKTENVFRKSK